MKADDDTGIMLFVYDRPVHTRRVLNGLRQNDIDHLYVFSDGPKTESDRAAVEATRDVIRGVDFCDVELIAHTENYGVERSVVEGYDYVFDRHEKAIMLEDDCVPAPGFSRFMRACLDRYEEKERVMNVHAYCPPIDIPDSYPYDVFFTWRSGSWGQGTWRSAWEKLDRDPEILRYIKSNENIRKRVNRAGRDLIPMLEKEIEGRVDSIGVWWSINIILEGGICVNACNPYVKNIGHDGTGVHCSDTDRYDNDLFVKNSNYNFELPASINIDKEINKKFVNFIDGGGIKKKIQSLKNALLRIGGRVLEEMPTF